MKTIKQKLIFLGVLIISSPLAIGNLRLNSFTYPAIWIFLPFLIYSLFPGRRSLPQKIALIVFTIFYSLIFFVFLLPFVLCGCGPTKDRYVSKENDNLKLVGRDFSCFGTTGDLVLYRQFSVSENIKLEIYYKTFVDYENINVDTAVWKPIKEF
jgi:hypothetical protein